MALILKPGEWNRQPASETLVDPKFRTLRLRELFDFYSFGFARSAFTGKKLAMSGTTYLESVVSGDGRYPGGRGQRYNAFPTDSTAGGFDPAFTSSALSYTFEIFANWGTGTSPTGVHSDYLFDAQTGRFVVGNDSGNGFGVYDGSWRYFSADQPWGEKGPQIIHVTCFDSGTHKYYKNGKLLSSVTSGAALSLGGAVRVFSRYTPVISSEQTADDIDFLFFGFYERPLSPSQILWRAQNPWAIYFPPFERSFHFFTTAGAGTTVTATTGISTWNGLGATVRTDTQIDANVATSTWQGLAANLDVGTLVDAKVGTATWQGLSSDIRVDTDIQALVATSTWQGLAAAVDIGQEISVQGQVGTATWQGLAATITVVENVDIQATTGFSAWGGLGADVQVGDTSTIGLVGARVFRPRPAA